MSWISVGTLIMCGVLIVFALFVIALAWILWKEEEERERRINEMRGTINEQEGMIDGDGATPFTRA